MKKITILLISFYQVFVSTAMKNVLGVKNACRFTPTCSEYAKIQIKKHGVVTGGKMAITRLLHCQPFSALRI